MCQSWHRTLAPGANVAGVLLNTAWGLKARWRRLVVRRRNQPLPRPRVMSLCAVLAIAACLNPRPEEVPGVDELPGAGEPDNSFENPPVGAGGSAGSGGQQPVNGAAGGSAGEEVTPPRIEPADAGPGPAIDADGGEPDGGL